MLTFFVAFVIALALSSVLTVVVRDHAIRRGVFDQATSSRKVHSGKIPRVGGIAIVCGFFAPLVGLLIVRSSEVGRIFRTDDSLMPALFLGGLVIALLGLWDDLRGTRASQKFTVQFVVAIGLYLAGIRIENLAMPFGSTVELGWLSLPVSVFWVVGLINAMNLIDGLDGLAGGVALFAVLTNFILAAVRGDVLVALAMAALGGAIIGFLIFNFNPASIFMGDTGSMFLGFVLALVSMKTSSKSGTTVAMLVPVISLGLPITDTLLAIGRRAMLGRPLFSADREHIHHRLMRRGMLSHRGTVFLLYGLCGLFALTALTLAYATNAQTATILACVALVMFILMRDLGYLNWRNTTAVGEIRRRNSYLRGLVRNINGRIAVTGSAPDLWEAIYPLAEELRASHMVLEVRRKDTAHADAVRFHTERKHGRRRSVNLSVDLKQEETLLGRMMFEWRDGRREVSRDEELVIELLAESISKALVKYAEREAADPQKVVSIHK